MVTVNLTGNVKDALAKEQNIDSNKSTAFVETPTEWQGDLKIELTPQATEDAIMLFAILRGDEADISIGSSITPNEADELADALREAADVLRDYSE